MRSCAFFFGVVILGGCSLVLTEQPNATDASSDDGDGGIASSDAGAVPQACGKTTLLRDDFEALNVNPKLWSTTGSVTQEGGTLNLAVGGGELAEAIGLLAHDLHESELVFEVASFPSEAVLRVDLATTIDGVYTTLQLAFSPLPAGDLMVTVNVGDFQQAIGTHDSSEKIWRISRTGVDVTIESRSLDDEFSEHLTFNPSIDLSRVSLDVRLSGLNVASTAAIESVNGGNTSPEVYCPTSSLIDDFSSASVLDHWKEAELNCRLTSTGVGVVESAGNLYCRFLGASGYALDAAGVSVSLVNLASAGGDAGLRILSDLSIGDGVEIRLRADRTLRVKTPFATSDHPAVSPASSIKFRVYVRKGTVVVSALALGGELVELETFPFEQMPPPPLRVELFVTTTAGHAEFDDLGRPD